MNHIFFHIPLKVNCTSSSQILNARFDIPADVFNEILALERKAIVTLLTRKKTPHGFLLMNIWRTSSYLYARYLSTSVLQPMVQQLLDSWCSHNLVLDCIATEEEIVELHRAKRPGRHSELCNILEMFRQFGEKRRCSNLSFALAVLPNVSEALFEVSGHCLPEDLILRLLKSAISSSNMLRNNPYCTLPMSTILQLLNEPVGSPRMPLLKQYAVLNSFPSLNLSHRSSDSREHVAQAWVRTSCKSLMIQSNPQIDMIIQKMTPTAYTLFRRKRTSPYDKRLSLSRKICLFNRKLTRTAACHLTFAPKRLSVGCSVVFLFKQSLMQNGHIRLHRASPKEVHILWSKFDVTKGMCSRSVSFFSSEC